MAATGFIRGHEVFYDGDDWYYKDTKQLASLFQQSQRACWLCEEVPVRCTEPECDDYWQGFHDPCIGHVKGVMSACCGHGRKNPYWVEGKIEWATG